MTYGMQLTALQAKEKCPAQHSQNIAGWIQQLLIKANVGQNMDNHGGHQQTALPKY